MFIFILNIGGDLKIGAIIDILAPPKGDSVPYITRLTHVTHNTETTHSLDSLLNDPRECFNLKHAQLVFILHWTLGE